MRLNVLANFMCCSWEQHAKVPPTISLMSVREMSTVCSLSQCSKAAGPIQQKSAGRVSISIRVSWIIFRPFQTNCPQGAAFFKGSGVETRLRRKLIETFVWVSYMG